MHAKSGRLFTLLAGFVLANAIVPEFVGIKVYAFEPTLGIPQLNSRFFGQEATLNFTAVGFCSGPSCS